MSSADDSSSPSSADELDRPHHAERRPHLGDELMLLWSLARASAFVAFGAYTGVVVWGIPRRRPRVPPRSSGGRVPPVAGFARTGRHRRARDGACWWTPTRTSRSDRCSGSARRSPSRSAPSRSGWPSGLPLSFKLRQAKFISFRVWRKLHWFGYATWVVMLAHGVLNGTDTGSPYAAALYAGSLGLVGSAVVWRRLRRHRRLARPGPRLDRRPPRAEEQQMRVSIVDDDRARARRPASRPDAVRLRHRAGRGRRPGDDPGGRDRARRRASSTSACRA